MKILKLTCFIAAAAVCCLFNTSCQTESKSTDFFPAMGKKLYLSQNIWYRNPDYIYAMNYKMGDIIPAGTQIVGVRYTDKEITFRLAYSNKAFKMVYRREFHKMPVREFVARLFTDKTLADLTRGFTGKERYFVRTGKLCKGVSKKAVLVGYGYPPACRTSSLSNNTWYYWDNKFYMKALVFVNDRLVSFN